MEINKRNGKKKEMVFSLIGLIIMVSIFIYSIFNEKNKKKELGENKKYTICYTNGITRTASMSFIKYVYYVNNVKYESKERYIPGRFSDGIRYYIIFSPKDPKNNQVQWNMVVPETVQSAPPAGWDYPPQLEPD
jgi:hypothetical protein